MTAVASPDLAWIRELTPVQDLLLVLELPGRRFRIDSLTCPVGTVPSADAEWIERGTYGPEDLFDVVDQCGALCLNGLDVRPALYSLAVARARAAGGGTASGGDLGYLMYRVGLGWDEEASEEVERDLWGWFNVPTRMFEPSKPSRPVVDVQLPPLPEGL